MIIVFRQWFSGRSSHVVASETIKMMMDVLMDELLATNWMQCIDTCVCIPKMWYLQYVVSFAYIVSTMQRMAIIARTAVSNDINFSQSIVSENASDHFLSCRLPITSNHTTAVSLRYIMPNLFLSYSMVLTTFIIWMVLQHQTIQWLVQVADAARIEFDWFWCIFYYFRKRLIACDRILVLFFTIVGHDLIGFG